MDTLPEELVKDLFKYLEPHELDSLSTSSKAQDSFVQGVDRADCLLNCSDWRQSIVNKYLGPAGVFFNYHEFREHARLVWEPTLTQGKLRIRNFEFDFAYEADVVSATHNYRGTVALIAPDPYMWGMALNFSCPPRLVAVVSRSRLLSLFTTAGHLLYSTAQARTMHQWNMQCRLVQSRICLGQMGGIGVRHKDVRHCFIDERLKGGIAFQPCESPQTIYSVVNSLQHMAYQSTLMLESVQSVIGQTPQACFSPDRSPLYWDFPM